MNAGFLARVHPVCRVLCLVLSFVPPFLASTPLALAPVLVVLVAGVLDARAWPALRRLLPVMAVLFAMSVALWTVFRPGGAVLWSWGPLGLHEAGFAHGVLTGLRLQCFVLAAVAFLGCTRIEDLTWALARLGVPWTVSFALSLSFRLTPLFLETGATILQAQAARGLDLDRAGPLARLRQTVAVMVPILVSGLRRADQLAIALEVRGFGRGGSRSRLTAFPVTWRDGVLPLLLVAVGAAAALPGGVPAP